MEVIRKICFALVILMLLCLLALTFGIIFLRHDTISIPNFPVTTQLEQALEPSSSDQSE